MLELGFEGCLEGWDSPFRTLVGMLEQLFYRIYQFLFGLFRTLVGMLELILLTGKLAEIYWFRTLVGMLELKAISKQ